MSGWRNSGSVVIDGVEGGDLLAALDLADVAASTGSACTSGSVEPSHVLLAMGYSPRMAHGSLRLTVGRGTTEDEVDRALAVIGEAVPRLRALVGPRPAVAALS